MVVSQAMEFICAANWKMNQDVSSSRQFLVDFFNQVSPQDVERFMFFPPALLSYEFEAHNSKGLLWGAQNFYAENSGAFTGENSPELYKKLGAKVMLIGHSERRAVFSETNAMIKSKVKKCVELGLRPVLCVGETLAERESGQAESVVKQQLAEALGEKGPKDLVIAYEPVWAIGTGKVASVSDVQSMHGYIKTLVGQSTPILYGGSVKPENAGELFALESVNGFLIGGASLKCESLLSIFSEMKNRL